METDAVQALRAFATHELSQRLRGIKREVSAKTLVRVCVAVGVRIPSDASTLFGLAMRFDDKPHEMLYHLRNSGDLRRVPTEWLVDHLGSRTRILYEALRDGGHFQNMTAEHIAGVLRPMEVVYACSSSETRLSVDLLAKMPRRASYEYLTRLAQAGARSPVTVDWIARTYETMPRKIARLVDAFGLHDEMTLDFVTRKFAKFPDTMFEFAKRMTDGFRGVSLGWMTTHFVGDHLLNVLEESGRIRDSQIGLDDLRGWFGGLGDMFVRAIQAGGQRPTAKWLMESVGIIAPNSIAACFLGMSPDELPPVETLAGIVPQSDLWTLAITSGQISQMTPDTIADIMPMFVVPAIQKCGTIPPNPEKWIVAHFVSPQTRYRLADVMGLLVPCGQGGVSRDWIRTMLSGSHRVSAMLACGYETVERLNTLDPIDIAREYGDCAYDVLMTIRDVWPKRVRKVSEYDRVLRFTESDLSELVSARILRVDVRDVEAWMDTRMPSATLATSALLGTDLTTRVSLSWVLRRFRNDAISLANVLRIAPFFEDALALDDLWELSVDARRSVLRLPKFRDVPLDTLVALFGVQEADDKGLALLMILRERYHDDPRITPDWLAAHLEDSILDWGLRSWGFAGTLTPEWLRRHLSGPTLVHALMQTDAWSDIDDDIVSANAPWTQFL